MIPPPLRLVLGLSLSLSYLCLPALHDPAGVVRTPQDPARLLGEAEALRAEGSHGLALERFRALEHLELDAGTRAWVAFRSLDCAWRAARAARDPDPSVLEAARAGLEEQLDALRRPEQRGLLFAELSESLADFHWDQADSVDFDRAWPYYQQALAHWAASDEIETARARYLAIAWRLTEPRWLGRPWFEHPGSWVSLVPVEVLENAVRIALEPADRSRANLLLALKLQQGWAAGEQRRVRASFEAALRDGVGTPWLDDVLWFQAQWLETSGRLVLEPGLPARLEPDFVAAASVYRRLVEEFPPGSSSRTPAARERLARITAPEIGLAVTQAFLPGSRVRYELSWRNVERVELGLLPFDPLRQLALGKAPGVRSPAWLEALPTDGLETLARWEHRTGDDGRHVLGSATLELGPELQPGYYLLLATALGRSARALVLVSAGGLVVRESPGELLAWLCDVETSTPIPDAPVRLWQREATGQLRAWSSREARTDGQGLVRFDVRDGARRYEALLFAGRGPGAAFARGGARPADPPPSAWRIAVHTDRGAYRPGHTVHWKVIARHARGGILETPAGRELGLEVLDPRGEVRSDQRLALNEFGTAWGSFELGAADTLGEYSARFYLPPAPGSPERTLLGTERLLRLEEYRLPEFRVSVEAARAEDGAPRPVRLGEPLEGLVRAEAYFGGPVAGARVELLVHQRPFWWRPAPRHDYPWLHAPAQDPWTSWWGGPGQLVERLELVTDAEGQAAFRVATPEGGGSDLEYTLEARVTDLSRREVSGRETLRVTRQAYHVEVEPGRRVVRPAEPVTATFRAQDADGRAVQVSGQATLLRRRWEEVWVDPRGVRYQGAALEEVRRGLRHFPPVPQGDLPPWRPVRQGWVEERVAATDLATDAQGLATWRVAAPRRGYHELVWHGIDRWGGRVEARAALWVADEGQLELGYSGPGISIVVDRDSFRAGEQAPVLVVLDASNRHVLLTVQADRLFDAQVLAVPGDARLVTLELDERHVPDVHLVAATFLGGELCTATASVVVPPVDHFYDVELTPEPEEAPPGGRGALLVRTSDVDGRPVPAEVSLALTDASLDAIGADLSIDPRQFFFGALRGDQVQTWPLLGGLPRGRLVPGPDGGLRDERQAGGHDGTWGGAEGQVDFKRYVGLAGAGPTGAPWASQVAMGGVERTASRARGKAEAGEVQEQLLGLAFDWAGADEGAGGSGQAVAPLAEITVRADFRETALWQPAVVTDADGRARVELSYPESLTVWRATARAVGTGSRVGWGRAEARTRQPLVVRVEAPRFFRVGDECLVSLGVANRSEGPLVVTPTLGVEGLRLVGFVAEGAPDAEAPRAVELAAGEERRFDWRVRAEAPGSARLVGRAWAGELGDGVERTYPVVPYGLEVLVARSGRAAGAGAVALFELPAERAPGTTRVVARVTPNLALTLLDALPYLIDYPYGCTEQTLSRFLPAVVVGRTLSQLGLDPEQLAERSFGGLTEGAAARVMRPTKGSLAELDGVVRRGIERLEAGQLRSGGWGWWPGGREDPFMSAYAVFGLALAREAGAPVPPRVLEAGARFLDQRLVEAERDPELRAWMLHALATASRVGAGGFEPAHVGRAAAELFEGRARLGSYGQALLLLSLAELDADRARIEVLARNLRNGVLWDREPDASLVPVGGSGGAGAFPRAHWGGGGAGWRWNQDAVETTAFCLWALLETDPGAELVEEAVEWLIHNRRGAQWKNTRDTALAILALERYIRSRGLLERPVAFELRFNGESIGARSLSGADLLTAPLGFELPERLVRDGENRLEVLRAEGEGPLWFALEARFVSQERPIPARGHGLFVRRSYLELAPRPTLLAGPRLSRRPLAGGGAVESGRRVEVVHLLEAKEDLEYLVLEDKKPAGFEAVALQSGQPLSARRLTRAELEQRLGAGEEAYPERLAAVLDAGGAGTTGEEVALYQELREQHVALFVDRLPEGLWEIRYELRAQTPGAFQVLPALGWAMYVPEVRGNSQGLLVEVVEPGARGR